MQQGENPDAFSTVGEIISSLRAYFDSLTAVNGLVESKDMTFIKDHLRAVMEKIPSDNPHIPPVASCPILQLPLELLTYCFSFLVGEWEESARDLRALDSISLTCKRMRDASSHDPLWKSIFDADFGGSKLDWQSWRKAYRETAYEFRLKKNLKWVISQGHRVLLRKHLRHELAIPSGLYYVPQVSVSYGTFLCTLAVESGQLGCLQELLDADIEPPYAKALEIAIEFEEDEIFQYLIQHMLSKWSAFDEMKIDVLHECLLNTVRCANLEYAAYLIQSVKQNNMNLFAKLANYQPRFSSEGLYVVRIPLELAGERDDIHFVALLLQEGFSEESSFSRPIYSEDVEKLIKASKLGTEAFLKVKESVLSNYLPHQRIAESNQIPLDFEASELQPGAVIGVGNFSVVRAAHFKNSIVAVKLITSKISASITKEIEILRTVFHPNIVHFFGVTKLKEKESDLWSKYCIILELLDKPLYDVLHVEKKKLELTQKLDIAVGIAYAMHYLHKLEIVHNDLTSKNILLDKKLSPKVTDFGQSADLRDLSRRHNIGALPWCAPEVLNGQPCSPSSDCYSYGVILWEIFGGESPIDFGGMNALQLAHNVAERNFHFPIPGLEI